MSTQHKNTETERKTQPYSNIQLMAFLFALMDRFEVFGRPIGYLKVVYNKQSCGLFTGSIQFIKEKHQSMRRGQNLIVFSNVDCNTIFQATNSQCRSYHDMFKSQSERLYRFATDPIYFTCDIENYFEIIQ